MSDMRDRLAALVEEAEGMLNNDFPTPDMIAEYLIEHGVILPPCKVGDTVYYIEMCRTAEDFGKLYITHGKVKQCSFNKHGKWLVLIDGSLIEWGEVNTVAFLTREEAEKALREKENG